MKLLHVVGARPNYMKIAPIMLEAANHSRNIRQILVHTGQHYDANMSDIFFEDLNIPTPDYHLGIGSGSHAQQTARVMMAFEPVLIKEMPDILVVAGDVNSTLACAIVAVKLGIPVAHVEAGLRSFDWTMPEEINRILTDRISSILFTPSVDADENLLAEGIKSENIVRVGNVMIDTLIRLLPKAEARWSTLRENLDIDKYILVTLHRPSNVDTPEQLIAILAALQRLSESNVIIFPIHPRTRQRISEINFTCPRNILLIEPLGYLDFLALEKYASLVITDSGGVQEETSYLGIPCLTVRANTERPITIDKGTNQLVEATETSIVSAAEKALNSVTSEVVHNNPIELWDGEAARRIVDYLVSYHSENRSTP